MLPKVKEQWIIKINREEHILNGNEKNRLEEGMKRMDRWFKTEKGNILSISHIESVVLHTREIENQLPEGKKEVETISQERWDELKETLPIKTF